MKEAGSGMARDAIEHLERIHDEHPAIQTEYEALAPRYAAIRALIRARQAQQVSQSELARRMGVTQPVIARLESGSGARGSTHWRLPREHSAANSRWRSVR